MYIVRWNIYIYIYIYVLRSIFNELYIVKRNYLKLTKLYIIYLPAVHLTIYLYSTFNQRDNNKINQNRLYEAQPNWNIKEK